MDLLFILFCCWSIGVTISTISRNATLQTTILAVAFTISFNWVSYVFGYFGRMKEELVEKENT